MLAEPTTLDATSPRSLRHTWRGLRRAAPLLCLGVVVAVVAFFPIVMLIAGSLRDAPPGATGSWTTGGWSRAYGDESTYETLWTTAKIAGAAVLISTPIALMFAWVVVRTNTPGRALLERALLAPLFVPGVLLALSWTIIGSPRTGLANKVIHAVPGLDGVVFDIYSGYGMVFVFVLAIIPLTYFLLLPVLKNMDRALEEAAIAAGASEWRTAVKVTLPLMAPALIGGALLSAIRVFESLEIPALLRGGSGIEVFMTKIFFSIRLTPLPDYAEASALGMTIVFITAILVFMQARYVGARDFTTITARGGSVAIVDLGRLRFVTAAICWTYLFLAVLLPLGVLVFGSFERIIGLGELEGLTLRHWRALLNDRYFWPAVVNTVVISFGASLLATALGFAVGYVIVRRRGALGAVFEGVSWVPWSIPGAVLGLGLLWGYSLLPGRLYLSRWAMLSAFVAILLPVAVRQCTAALRQLDVHLEEAASAAGARATATFRRVVLPLMLRGLTATMTLGVILSIREVGMPAVLATRDTQVLGSLTLAHWVEGRASMAAAGGVVMVALAVVALACHALADRLLRKE